MIGLIIKLLRSYKLTDINLDKLEKNSASDSRSCFHCNGFDSSIPEHSAWKFCLIKGCYLSHDQLVGCDQSFPINLHPSIEDLEVTALGRFVNVNPMALSNTGITLNSGRMAIA
ncbi:hypothetical protein NON20_26065 (plasmid) [Synechocystis sp. B12]|nr:hypothetical protein NON20_26065 [Synechocystis sp. B12]